MVFVLCTYGAIYCWTAFFFLVQTVHAVLLASVRKKSWSKFSRIIDPSTIVIHKLLYQFTSAGLFLDNKPVKKCVITKKQLCPLPHCKSRIEFEYFSWFLNMWVTLSHLEIIKCTGFWCSLHSVHCRNPLFGIRNSSLHVHPTRGAGADTMWGCICVLPLWGGQGIQILIH